MSRPITKNCYLPCYHNNRHSVRKILYSFTQNQNIISIKSRNFKLNWLLSLHINCWKKPFSHRLLKELWIAKEPQVFKRVWNLKFLFCYIKVCFVILSTVAYWEFPLHLLNLYSEPSTGKSNFCKLILGFLFFLLKALWK